jgi:hypothetical protein
LPHFNKCRQKALKISAPKLINRKNFMKKLFFTAAFIICLQAVKSQDSTATPQTDTTSVPQQAEVPGRVTQPVESPSTRKDWRKIDLSNRANDHVMVQYGFDKWTGTGDSITPKGFSRFFNAYIMLDKPFKTNPKMSVGLGLGIGSSNIFFDKTHVDVKSLSTRLPFTRVDSANRFKKFKLTTIFL